MDSLHFHLKDIFPESDFITLELDYSDIVKQKIKFITESKVLSSCFPELQDPEKTKDVVTTDKKNFFTQNYYLMECDLANQTKITSCMKAAGLVKDNLTIIIGECLFCYMSNKETENLLSIFTSEFENCFCIYYDLISPNDDFGKMMIKNLKDYRGIILPAYKECPDEKAHEERMKKAGFTSINHCVDMLKYFNSFIDTKIKNGVNHLEFVDELEEWNLLQKHSCLGIAIKKSLDQETFEFLNKYELH